jgi:hypothetical protein
MGVIVLEGSGITYKQAAGYSPGISVRSDILYGSFSDHTRSFKAGQEIARRVAVFFMEVSPQETASLAQTCAIESTPAGDVLHFKQPDGKDSQVSLRASDASR